MFYSTKVMSCVYPYVIMNIINKIEASGFNMIRATANSEHEIVSVVDYINPFFLKKCTRSMIVQGTLGEYTKIPLFRWNHKLLIYRYCGFFIKYISDNKLKNALILGGGGGTIPLYLLQNNLVEHVDIVERSAAIIQLSKTYFLKKYVNSQRLKFYHADARNLMARGRRYDFIFCDLFIKDEVVPFILEQKFVDEVYNMTSNKGFLIINAGKLSVHIINQFLHIYGNKYKKIYYIKDNNAAVFLCVNEKKNIFWNKKEFNEDDYYYFSQLITD